MTRGNVSSSFFVLIVELLPNPTAATRTRVHKRKGSLRDCPHNTEFGRILFFLTHDFLFFTNRYPKRVAHCSRSQRSRSV